MNKIVIASQKKMISVKGNFNKVFDSAMALLKNYSNTKSGLRKKPNVVISSEEKAKDVKEML